MCLYIREKRVLDAGLLFNRANVRKMLRTEILCDSRAVEVRL